MRAHVLLLVAAAAVCTALPSGAAGTTPRSATLAWAPPLLVQPQTIRLPTTSIHLELSTARDYVLTLPPTGMVGTLWIEGGHNVRLVGGSITVPATANQEDNGSDNTDTAIYVKNATGTVHIEGVAIAAQTNTLFDGIDISAPKATVQIENVRISRVFGSDTSMHADVVQTWGGVARLRIDRLSANGDYQGLTIDPDLGPVGSVDIRHTNLTVDPVPPALAAATSGGGHMLWLTQGTDTCTSARVHLSDVYIDARRSTGMRGANVVWPQASATSLPCRAVLQNGRVSWPQLPVTGSVTLGAPPGGPFVPPGSVGNGYRSPFATASGRVVARA